MNTALAYSGSSVYSATFAEPTQAQIINNKVAVRSKNRKPWKILTKIFTFLMIFAVGSGLFVANSQQSQANWFEDAIKGAFCSQPVYFAESTPSRGGYFTMFSSASPLANLVSNNKVSKDVTSTIAYDENFLKTRKTAYEKYGMSGTVWTVYAGEIKEDKSREYDGRNSTSAFKEGDLRYNYGCVPVVNIIGTTLANNTLNVSKFVTSISGWTLANAFSPEWINSLMKSTEEIITGGKEGNGLRDSFYYPFFVLVVMLGALWLFKEAIIKRRILSSVQGILWMVIVTILGGMFVYNPSILPKMTNELTTNVTGALLTGTAGSTSSSTNSSELCYLESVNGNLDKKIAQIIRTSECRFWETFVFTPWVVGQFGTSYGNLTTDAPEVKLGGNAKFNNWALYQLETQVVDPSEAGSSAIDNDYKNFFRVVDHFGDKNNNDSSQWSVWAGNDSASRLMVAFASVVSSIMALIVVVVLSISMLVYSMSIVLLTYFAVPFLLIGLHPGMGRRLLMKWAEIYVEAILKKIIIAAIIGIMLIFYSVLLKNPSSNWQASIISIVVLSIGILMYRKELLRLVGNLDFGGGGELNGSKFGQVGQKLVQGTQVIGGGAAVGAVKAMPQASRAAAIAKTSGNRGAGTLAATKTVLAGAGAGARTGVSQVRPHGRKFNVSGYAGKVAGAKMVEGYETKVEADRKAMVNAAHGPALEEHKQREAVRVAAERQKQAQEKAQRDAERQKAERESKFRSANAQHTVKAAAQRKTNLEESVRSYRKDHAANKNNREWKRAFEKQYGFAAPDPSVYDFGGYQNAEDFRKDPRLMPRLRNIDTTKMTEAETIQSYEGMKAPEFIKETAEAKEQREQHALRMKQLTARTWRKRADQSSGSSSIPQPQPVSRPSGMPRPNH